MAFLYLSIGYLLQAFEAGDVAQILFERIFVSMRPYETLYLTLQVVPWCIQPALPIQRKTSRWWPGHWRIFSALTRSGQYIYAFFMEKSLSKILRIVCQMHPFC